MSKEQTAISRPRSTNIGVGCAAPAVNCCAAPAALRDSASSMDDVLAQRDDQPTARITLSLSQAPVVATPEQVLHISFASAHMIRVV